MMFEKSTTGAVRTSGKAKGAFGVKNMLAAVEGVAMRGEFGSSAVDIVTKMRNVTARIACSRLSVSMDGQYTVEAIRDHTLCYGNVWFGIGNGYTFSLHWEFLSGQERRAVETAILRDGKLITEDPVIHHFEASEVDTTYEIYDAFVTLVRYMGASGCEEDEVQF